MELEEANVAKTTYSIADILEWQRQGTLDLRPFYQRRSVWNVRMKSLLIDSLLRNFPIPLIFLYNSLDVKSSRTVRNVIDGQQRLRTILTFIDPTCLEDLQEEDRFTILRAHNREFSGMRFADLPDPARLKILETQLSVNLLPANVQDVTILKMFQRLNSTGAKLSGQEHRNATYSSDFKVLSYDLAYEQHQRWLGWGIFKRGDIAQMLEVEFTSDLFGFLLRGIDAGSRVAIDRLYDTYEGEGDEDVNIPDLESKVAVFRQTCDQLDAVFGDAEPKSFLKPFRTRAWVYAIFVTVAKDESRRSMPGEALRAALQDAQQRLETARDKDDDLSKVLRGATTHKSSRETRVAFLSRSF